MASAVQTQIERLTGIIAGAYAKCKIKGATLPASQTSDNLEATINAIPAQNELTVRNASNLSASGKTVSVPAGWYKSNYTKDVSTATQATPSITVDANGLITASATQTAGYVSAGTKSGTKQLTVETWTLTLSTGLTVEKVVVL